MLFSALGPTTVYADDGTPTDQPTTEGSETDGEPTEDATEEQTGDGEPSEEASEEQTGETGEGETEEATGEEVSTEEEPTGEAGDGEAGEAATEEELTNETGEGETDEASADEPSLMEQVPDNTDIVVVNTEGEVEPLATQEAAEAVATSDPIWCPAGQDPTPGENGCTDSYSSFDELLTFMQTNEGDVAYQQAGTIYVEMGTYGGGESSIDFNTYGFTTFDDNDLTIQGGWNTSTGTTTDTTTFNVPIVIGSDASPWGGSLTIRNIIVSGVVNDTGLTVYSGGSVTVEDSEFTNNDAAGVFIDADEDVNVRRTKVNDNGSNNWEVVDGRGLEIKSGGFVTLSEVEANDNQIFGVDIVAGKDVAIANSFFNGNLMYTPDLEFFGYGLKVVSQGDISLADVEANENYLYGASLNGSNVFIRDSFFNRNVSNTDAFIDDTGLLVLSSGDVFLRNIEANDNRLIGADIQAGGEIAIRDSFFNGNFGTTVDDTGAETYWGYGLRAVSTGDRVSLDIVQADDNYIFGANLVAAGDVTVTGSSFNNNAVPADQSDWGLNNKPVINDIELDLVPKGGLMIQSGGFVTLDTVTANNNLMFGADIVADGFIDIEDSVFSNNLNGFGLSAISNQTNGMFVTLTNVTAIGNAGDGAYLETLCGRTTVNGGVFAGNDQYGLHVVNSLLGQSASFDPPNGAGPTLVDVDPSLNCVFPSPLPSALPSDNSNDAVLYTIASQTQDELPASLDQGNSFVSALQLALTSQGLTAGNLVITLAFPIPAGMEGADLAVMFWNGTGWVEVPGGSVVGDQFVINVAQPGVYVLVAK
jgi:hypothetical protein